MYTINTGVCPEVNEYDFSFQICQFNRTRSINKTRDTGKSWRFFKLRFINYKMKFSLFPFCTNDVVGNGWPWTDVSALIVFKPR